LLTGILIRSSLEVRDPMRPSTWSEREFSPDLRPLCFPNGRLRLDLYQFKNGNHYG
jgi:hypothetical protein